MSFSPRFQGDLMPGFRFQFQDDNNNNIDISAINPATPGNFTVILLPKPGVDQPGVARIVGGGAFAFTTNGTDGQINYSPVAADVQTPGQYITFCVALFTGNKPMTSDGIPLLINPKP